MKTLDELIKEEEEFQKHLLPGHYTLIASTDLLSNRSFLLAVNDCAPVVAISRTVHHALSNKDCVHKVLRTLSANISLEIFIITPDARGDYILLHDGLESYCQKNNIGFKRSNPTEVDPLTEIV